MSRKSKNHRYIYSIFSKELQSYPYFPFIAKNHNDALRRFIRFVSSRECICEGADLHCIGECYLDSSSNIIHGSEQPFAIPIEINFKNNLLSKTFIVGEIYRLRIERYFQKLNDLYRKEKNYVRAN